MKIAVFWDVTSCGSYRTDFSRSSSIIRVTRNGELGATLAVGSNRRKLRTNTIYYTSISSQLGRLLVKANVEEWCLLGCYAVWLL
jgi:hypothetical protein